MNSTIINIKTDPKVKKEAQKVASDLGLTLSGAINGFLRQLIRDKAIVLSMKEVPSDYLISSIRESEKERKRGDVYSFENGKDAVDFVKNL